MQAEIFAGKLSNIISNVSTWHCYVAVSLTCRRPSQTNYDTLAVVPYVILFTSEFNVRLGTLAIIEGQT